jgi:hypothetical protein
MINHQLSPYDAAAVLTARCPGTPLLRTPEAAAMTVHVTRGRAIAIA